MKKEYLVYWLVNDFNLIEDHPELICATKVARPEFEEKQLTFGRGRMEKIWPKDFMVHVAGSQPVDFLLCTPHIEAVSDRAKEVMQEFAVDEIEFLPVKVFDENGMRYTAMNYWAMNVLTVLDVLDWENTTWITSLPPSRDDPLAILSIIKPCFSASKIHDTNIFHFEVAGKNSAGKYVSRLLKNALQRAGCTIGIEFTPVKTT